MLNQKYISKTSAVLRLIPDDEVNVVINRGQRYSAEAWWWGDRANLWWEYVKQSEEPLSKDDAQLAMSQVSGIPKRTLRYYADVARFWEMEHREEYDPLPFSHFAVAKSYREEKCIDVLKFAIDYLELYNKLPSAEYIEWSFSRKAIQTQEIDSEFSDGKTYDAFVETPIDEIHEEQSASLPVARDWISRTDNTLSKITQALDPLPISEESKEKIRGAIFNLHKAFEEAIKEISYTSQG